MLLLGALLLVAIVVGVRVGAVSLSVGEIVDALLGEGDQATIAIVRELRLPRALQAALVGAALSAAGATFQALLRNPLADPYVLGVSSGAALGAVAAVAAGLATAAWVIPAAAFVGAVIAMLAVLRISVSESRVLDTRVLLLGGVIAGTFFNAAILLVLTFADADSFRSAIFWMMGSNAGASWTSVVAMTAYLLPGLIVLLALARALNLLAIGERTATYLGASVHRTRLTAYAIASLLTGAAVAVSGAIGFVGLVIPHVVRMLWGSDNRALLPASALLGAAFLVLADALARVVAAPSELPIGVVTAFVGVPFFVWLLRRRAA